MKLKQTSRQLAKLLGVRRGIVDDGLAHPVEHASARIDLLNREECRLELRLFDGGSNSRLGEEYPPAPRTICVFAEPHDFDLYHCSREIGATLRQIKGNSNQET